MLALHGLSCFFFVPVGRQLRRPTTFLSHQRLFSHLRALRFLSPRLFAGSWASSANSKDISHSLPTPSYSFTQIWDLALCRRRRASDCAGVRVWVRGQWSAMSMTDSSSSTHPGREEWAAIETRTLVAFTTVEVKHRVCAKCRRTLLPWKGPLSRVSFQVPAEREPTESHSQQVFVCQPVCASLKSSIFYLYRPVSQQKLFYDTSHVE